MPSVSRQGGASGRPEAEGVADGSAHESHDRYRWSFRPCVGIWLLPSPPPGRPHLPQVHVSHGPRTLLNAGSYHASAFRVKHDQVHRREAAKGGSLCEDPPSWSTCPVALARRRLWARRGLVDVGGDELVWKRFAASYGLLCHLSRVRRHRADGATKSDDRWCQRRLGGAGADMPAFGRPKALAPGAGSHVSGGVPADAVDCRAEATLVELGLVPDVPLLGTALPALRRGRSSQLSSPGRAPQRAVWGGAFEDASNWDRAEICGALGSARRTESGQPATTHSPRCRADRA